MRKIIFLGLMLVFFSITAFAQKLTDDFKKIKSQVLQDLQAQNFEQANKEIQHFIKKNKKDKDQLTLQAAYGLYADVLFVQRSYKEAADVLKEAIEKYDSEVEKYLVNQQKDYVKYVNKPKLSINYWYKDQKSCEEQKGIWYPPREGKGFKLAAFCNLPTTDAGKECSDSVECQGGCVVEKDIAKGTSAKGKCSGRLDYSENGCANTVSEGIVNGNICR